MTPSASTVLMPNDHLVVIGTETQVAQLEALAAGDLIG